MALRQSTLLARFGLQQALRAASCGTGRQLGARAFAAEAGKSSGSGKWIAGLAAVGAGVWGAKELGYIDFGGKGGKTMSIPLISEPKRDYGAVRQAIEDILDAPEGYDDGSYGPVLVRLAWHASGTYDKATNTGGSNGATMRWAPESNHAANAGLQVARELLEPIKKQFPWISYADLWTLAGATAVEAMGGPVVPWRPGRKDSDSETDCPPDMRLPDAAKGAPHVRDVFGRMGFEDRDTVALIGAHSLGRCHTDRSGYKGPWTNAPTTFSNLYFQELVNNKWRKKKWDGPLQYEDKTGELMMLPTDMALLWDRKFKQYVDEYAKDEDKFFKDFASAFSRLMELGVPFPNAATAAAT